MNCPNCCPCCQKADQFERETNALRKENEELSEQIDIWKDRAEINGKAGFKFQDERDALRKQCEALASAITSLKNLADTDFMKSKTDDGEIEYWVNDDQVQLICDEALSAWQKFLDGGA